MLPCAAYLEGEYGIDGLYVGVPGQARRRRRRGDHRARARRRTSRPHSTARPPRCARSSACSTTLDHRGAALTKRFRSRVRVTPHLAAARFDAPGSCSCSDRRAASLFARRSRRTSTSSCPTARTRSRRSSSRGRPRAANGRRDLLRRRDRPQGDAARAALRRPRTSGASALPARRRSSHPGVTSAQQESVDLAEMRDLAADRGGRRAARARAQGDGRRERRARSRRSSRASRRRQARADRRDRRGRRQAGALTRLYVAARDARDGRSARTSASRSCADGQKRIVGLAAHSAAASAARSAAIVGIYRRARARSIHLPIRVSIDATATSAAPRRGSPLRSTCSSSSGDNVDHGHKIAATGEIFLNGAVGPIGGIKQKTIGAREAGVDAFLVPAGQNATDAEEYAHGLRIIPVKSFQQALRALATLPAPKHAST